MTTDALPDPLVPAEVDLRGFGWMPYYGDHLSRSEFNARVSDAGYRAAHNLWWAAWNNVPAASLPDDEVALTRFADLGRDVKAFRKIRAEAMHGFVKCSDGRWYHTFLAKEALAAWDKRVKQRDRKQKWREGRGRSGHGDGTGTTAGHRAGQNDPVPVGRNGDGTDDRTGQDRTVPPSPPLRGLGQAVPGYIPVGCIPWTKDGAMPEGSPPGADIVWSYHKLVEAFWGADPPPWLTPKDVSIAQGWVERGAEYEPVRALMEERLRAMCEAKKSPPPLRYFEQPVAQMAGRAA